MFRKGVQKFKTWRGEYATCFLINLSPQTKKLFHIYTILGVLKGTPLVNRGVQGEVVVALAGCIVLAPTSSTVLLNLAQMINNVEKRNQSCYSHFLNTHRNKEMLDKVNSYWT